jgi:hypothetical protein
MVCLSLMLTKETGKSSDCDAKSSIAATAKRPFVVNLIFLS